MVNDIKFNSQAFILSYIDQVIEDLNPYYDHVLTLDTTQKSFAECVALMNGKSEALSISKLKTHQYNALIPKIRLFRVNSEDTSEYEFVFNKNYRTSNLVIEGDSLMTGNNCGIKSINWILAGTNPVSAEKTIEVKLEFYFDSINSFSGGSYNEMLNLWNSNPSSLLQTPFDNPKTRTTTNFWSLIYHPKLRADEYQSPLFRIKAVVGWEQIDPNIVQELFAKDKMGNINEELYDSDLVMYLNLVQHNFEFNEDGSIKLTANYIASLENSFSSKPFDLLRGLKESIDKLKFIDYNTLLGINAIATSGDGVDLSGLGDNLEGVKLDPESDEKTFERLARNDRLYSGVENLSYSSLESKIKFLRYIKENQGNLDNLAEEIGNCDSTSDKQQLIDIIVNSAGVNYTDKLEGIITTFQDQLDQTQQEIDKAIQNVKLYHYSKLLQNLLKNKGNGKYAMYGFTLSASSVTEWLSWKNGKTKVKPTFNLSVGESSNVNLISNAAEVISLDREAGDTADFGEYTSGNGERYDLSNYQQQANKPDNFDEAMDVLVMNEESITSKNLFFTTIGHIVDSAFEIVSNNVFSKGDRAEIFEFMQNKMVFSTFAPSLARVSKSIACIPVEMNYLIKLLDEILYQRGATELSLFQFLKELTVKVAEPALQSREIPTDDGQKYANTSISSTIVSLGSNNRNGSDPLSTYFSLANNNKIISLNGKKKSDFRQYYLTYSNLKNRGLQPFNYFIIYDRFNKDFAGAENKITDEAKGVYHFTIAQNYGLIKSINFTKIDQPFLKESKSVGKKTIYLGQFRDLYNASIKMIGNNLFHPGMILFIKPTIEFGKVISNNPAKPTFAQLTGVGGYYTVIKVDSSITDESYTTNLTCVFHSNDGNQPEANKEECKVSELEKAGLLNPDGSIAPVSGFLTSKLEEIRKELKEDEEEQKRKEEQLSLSVGSSASEAFARGPKI